MLRFLSSGIFVFTFPASDRQVCPVALPNPPEHVSNRKRLINVILIVILVLASVESHSDRNSRLTPKGCRLAAMAWADSRWRLAGNGPGRKAAGAADSDQVAYAHLQRL